MERELQKIADLIGESEMALIGIGEEFGEKKEGSEGYENYPSGIGERTKASDVWTEPFMQEYRVRHRAEPEAEKALGAYDALARLLKDKDYFVVTLNQDGLVDKSRLMPDRIVAPCGNRRLLQCAAGCCDTLWDASDEIERIGECLSRGMRTQDVPSPVCPECGGNAAFNRIDDTARYIEAGYLGQWSAYRGWLAQTLNRRLTVLELGVGMEYPNIIRWPFERIVFLNQKATLVRVHGRLPQLSEELSQKGRSVRRNPIELFSGVV